MLKNQDRMNTLPPTASAHERAALILDLAGEAIVTIDDGDVIRSWNRAAEALFGYTAAEVVGRSFAVLVPAERRVKGSEQSTTTEIFPNPPMAPFPAPMKQLSCHTPEADGAAPRATQL